MLVKINEWICVKCLACNKNSINIANIISLIHPALS